MSVSEVERKQLYVIENLFFQHEKNSIPENAIIFKSHVRFCSEIYPRIINDSNLSTSDKGRFLAVTCNVFIYAREFELLFKAGRFLPESFSSPDFPGISIPVLKPWEARAQAIGHGAMKCYEWSLTSTTFADRQREISFEINKLRPGNLKPSDQEPVYYEVLDQYELCRVHVASLAAEKGMSPKIYIAVTGTRGDDEVTSYQNFQQWIFTNFNAFPVKTSEFGWIHGGFYKMFTYVFDKIEQHLAPFLGHLQNHQVEVCVVGHSLGAALANLLTLKIASFPWCQSCVAFSVATPSAFCGHPPIPFNCLLTSFVNEYDMVSITRPLSIYNNIGDTFVLEGRLGAVSWNHTDSFKEFFNNFTFASAAIKVKGKRNDQERGCVW